MDKLAPYKSIQLVAKAGMLECPIRNILPCGLCQYGSFCHALGEAFTEARKLAEEDKKIADIINHEYEEKIKRQHQEGEC